MASSSPANSYDLHYAGNSAALIGHAYAVRRPYSEWTPSRSIHICTVLLSSAARRACDCRPPARCRAWGGAMMKLVQHGGRAPLIGGSHPVDRHERIVEDDPSKHEGAKDHNGLIATGRRQVLTFVSRCVARKR